jgi:hypothetical protein
MNAKSLFRSIAITIALCLGILCCTIATAQFTFVETTYAVPNIGGGARTNGSTIRSADFNHDGWADIAMVGYRKMMVMLGTGNGSFAPVDIYSITPNPASDVATNLAFGDFNEDGHIDIVVSPGDAYSYSIGAIIFYGTGSGTFNPAAALPSPHTGSDIVQVADFNNDGHDDVVSAFAPNRYVHLGTGTGTFNSSYTPGLPFHTFIFIKDVNNDGFLDFASGYGPTRINLGDGTGNFSTAFTFASDPGSNAILEDMDGDNIVDLVGQQQYVIVVYKGNGDGTFQAAPFAALVPTNNIKTHDVKVVDINNDGHRDILVTHSRSAGTSRTFILAYLGDGVGGFGTETFLAESQPSSYDDYMQFDVADLNNDGRLDFSIKGQNDEVWVLLNTTLQPPSIALFTPFSGPIGTTVTITGTNFDPVAANNTVKFNGVDAATPTVASATSLTVTVPTGATTGPISVTTLAGTGTSTTDFIVICTPLSPPTATNVSRCGDGTVTLSATGATGTQEYRWYEVASGGTSLNSTATYTTPALTITTSYYVSIFEVATSCESNRTQVDAIINTPPAAPTGTPNSGCSDTSITLNASGGSSGQYRWYTVATGGTPDATQTNDTYSTPNLTSTTSYYVAINDGICESARTEVVATINPIPATPGAISGTITICSGSTNTYSVAPVSGAISYNWALPTGWTGTSTTNSISTTASATSGNISVTAVNTCGTSSASSQPVSVITIPTTSGTISGTTTICSGSTNTYSVTPVSGATSYNWTLPTGWTGTSTTNSISTTASATSGNISVNAVNTCGTSAAESQPVTVLVIPPAPGTINGTTTICSGSTNTYSVTPVSGATSYNWALPTGWTGTSTTNSISTTASATSGNISVTAVNTCGTSFASSQLVSVITIPATPGTISGTTTICSGSTNTYSVTPISGATSYNWTLPTGWTGTSTTNSISTTASATSGSISVTATNTCGTSAAASQPVTVMVIPPTPSTITGTTTICSGSTNMYSVTPVSGATSYNWTLPAGWTGNSTTNSIDITTSTSSGTSTISVTAANACGASDVASLQVLVQVYPENPGGIFGATTICSESFNNYYVIPLSPQTTYVWTLPYGWTGTPYENAINTIAGPTSGTISVLALNTCGVSRVEQFVTVGVIPAAPSAITGTTAICSGSTNIYSVMPVVGATSYHWTLPDGWTGNSTTNSISITASTTSGTISVTAVNTCGTSSASAQPVSVITIPATPGSISGTTTICSGSTNTYSVTPVSGATSYNWTLPAGWAGTSTTNSISTTANATSGNISVTAANTCGTSAAISQLVMVVTPNAPTINPVNPVCPGANVTLRATGATSGQYRWYEAGSLITGATGSTYTVVNITTNRTFEVSVFDLCESPKTSVTATVVDCTLPPAKEPSVIGSSRGLFCQRERFTSLDVGRSDNGNIYK